jgi:crossover junction endonuclease EME1
MPEIISLLSSPVNSPPKQSRDQPRPSAGLARGIFNFGSDDFDFTGLSGDLDFPISQPTKKRKLSTDQNDVVLAQKPAKPHVYTISDDEDLSLPQVPAAKDGRSAASEYQWESLMSDPIGFSSSAPEARTVNQGKVVVLDLSDDLPEDFMALGESFSLSQPVSTANGRKHLSERTANLLAGLNEKPNTLGSKSRSHKSTAKANTRTKSMDDILSSSPMRETVRKITKSSKLTEAAKEARAAERATAQAAKDREREEEKERKRLAKEQKAKEKQEAADIAEVNKSKTDKKASVTEMIVEMSQSLQGKSVGNQVVEYMKQLGVDTTFFEEEVDLPRDDEMAKSYGSFVKWSRKVKARYNGDAGYWEPVAEHTVENERHILVHLTASDFAGIATSRMGSSSNREGHVNEQAMIRNLDVHASDLRKKYKDCKPIYLIEGLEAFLRKNKIAKNRAYTAAVLSQLPPSDPSAPPASSQPRPRKKITHAAPDYTFIDTDLVESLLLHLQLTHAVLIHHTTTPSDTAFWIRTFTEHISTIAYRHERMALNDAGATFCMDAGQVKTGDDARDTYVKMLQEVQRVTPAMAYGITNLYPNVRALARAFREEGPLVLEDVKKGANRDGAVTDSRLGPAVSRRLYKVFMGRNEWSTDGIA